MTDRRRYKRYRNVFKVLYRGIGQVIWRNQSCTQNVSLGGINLYMKKLVTEGERIILKIYNPSSPEPIQAKAKVVWVNGHDAGLKFTNISWNDAKNLVSKE